MGDSRIRSDAQQSTGSFHPGRKTTGYRLEDQPTVITACDGAPLEPASSEAKVEIVNPRLSPGNTVGPYELLEFIGGGGMGRVFRAYDVRLSRIVALKVLTAEQASDPQILARFQNEARSAARLSHPGIVQVFSAGEDSGIYYIAFEFVDGTNLRTLVEQRGPLSVIEALHYVLQVAEALDHASRHGVIHRDIKPSNIIVTPEGRTKLIDLGLARMFQQNGRSQDLTTSGMTLGTFDYIAPEQARDPRLADIRSDIYSLGCTLYFLLSGQPPFPGGSVLQKLLQHQSEEPPNIRNVRPDVPEAVARILRRMMAKSPRQRYQTPGELIQALRNLLGVEGQTVQPVRQQKPTVDKRLLPLRQHLPWLVPVVGLLVSTLVLDWWWSQGAEETMYFGDDIRHTEGLFSPLTPTLPATKNDSETGNQRGKPAEWQTPARTPSPVAPGSPSQTIRSSEQGGADQKPETGIPTANGTPSTDRENAVAKISPTTPSEMAFPKLPDTSAPLLFGTALGGKEGGTAKNEPRFSGGVSHPYPYLSSSVSSTMARGTSDVVPSGSQTSSLVSERLSPMSMSSEWVRIVDPSLKEPGSYPTLEAACEVALPGDEIRLNFDGPLVAEGCDLRGRQLTIRAAKGRFPELVFRPSDRLRVRGDSFYTLAASHLVCEDVAVRVEIPPEYASDDWYLFRITHDSILEFNRCVFTLIAGAGPKTAVPANINAGSFFVFREDPRSELVVRAVPERSTDESRGSIVRLQRCIVRGECDIFRSASCQPSQIVMSESFISVTGRLLDMEGTERSPSLQSGVSLELRRLTMWTASGLIRQSQLSYQPHLQPIRVGSENCIFVAHPESAFIEQRVTSVDMALRLLMWFGQRNFYEQFSRFWSVVTGSPNIAPLQLSFDYWKAYWRTEHEQDPVWGGIPWRGHLPLDAPPHSHRPIDFALMDPSLDDIAADVSNRAGCPLDQMPFLPPLEGYSGEISSGGVSGQ